MDPDQFYFGGHVERSPLIDRLHFRPNVEVGFGDDLTLITANMDFVYKFPTSGRMGPVRRRRAGPERLHVR